MNDKLLSMIKFSKIAMEQYGCVAVRYDLFKVWKAFAELPLDEGVRFFLINNEIRKGKHYACLINLNPEKPSLIKKDAREPKGVLAELLANYRSIITGKYEEKKRKQKSLKKAKKRKTPIKSKSKNNTI